jgi:hypothetical protein
LQHSHNCSIQVFKTKRLVLSISFWDCSKDEVDEITYEVTLVNSTKWYGAYLNENAEVVGVSDGPSGWTYSFRNTNDLTVVSAVAFSDRPNAGGYCEMKILLNGRVVASGTTFGPHKLEYVSSNINVVKKERCCHCPNG